MGGGWAGGAGGRRRGLQWSTLFARRHQRSRTPFIQPPPDEAPRSVTFLEGDHPRMGCGHLTMLCAGETTPCVRPQESLRRRVVVTRGTGALSLQQGDLGVWRKGDYDTLFRCLFLMQIKKRRTARTNTFTTYSAQHEPTSYIYDLIYPHKKSVR